MIESELNFTDMRQMIQYLYNHAFYHDINETDAEKLIYTTGGTFLFCNANPGSEHKYKLCCKAMYHCAYEIRTLSITSIDLDTVTFLGRKLPTLSSIVIHYKQWIGEFGKFDLVPIINPLHQSFTAGSDCMLENKHQQRLYLCISIYNKLKPFVSEPKSFQNKTMIIHDVKPDILMQFSCVLCISDISIQILISPTEIYKKGNSKNSFIDTDTLVQINLLIN